MKDLYALSAITVDDVNFYHTYKGYEIRVNSNGRWFYVESYYNGKYTFCTDYLYAKHFSLVTAKKHLNKLRREM